MNLVIGENEGKILKFLENRENQQPAVIHKEALIPRSSVTASLWRMVGKGWLSTKADEANTLFTITSLGKKALAAWKVYMGEVS